MPQDKRIEKSGEKSPQFRSLALVAVGSNEPFDAIDTKETIQKAVDTVGAAIGAIRFMSRFFRTPAFPAGSGPEFVNAAFAMDTALGPQALLDALHGIEAQFGRQRKQRWAARTLDLDLIAYGDLVLPNRATYRKWADLALDEQMRAAPEGLVLPHPRLHERAFVLIPLLDIAAEWTHPVFGRTVAEMVEALPKARKAEVRPV